MNSILKTQNLSIGYKDKNKQNILHQTINLTLRKGEMVCLLGPNGAGKSTLLRTLAGVQNSLDGEILLNNKSLNSYSIKELAHKIGIVLTERSFNGMRVQDLVSLGRYPYTGFFARLTLSDNKIVLKVLKDTGLLKYKKKLINELSDGEQQRVMIARVLAQQTPLIILDEPTAFLDLPGRYEIFQMLLHLAHEHGKTIVLSTHDLDLAIKFADKIWLLARDKAIISGIPEDLILNKHFAGFFDNDNLRFDSQSGTFEALDQAKNPIRLNGKGLEAFWISKALNRKGFFISTQANVELHIHVEKCGHYILESNNEKVKAESIESLMELL